MFNNDKKRRLVDQAADLSHEARDEAEKARAYYDGYQWTAEEIAILKRRKQPIITYNRIKRKVDALKGIEQRSRVDPAAYPRNPDDEGAADIATKALRYVEEVERIDIKRSDAFENLLIEGYGGVEVVAEFRAQAEVCVRKLRWEEIFYDPYSREKDFSDAAYVGVQKWMHRDRAKDFLAPYWDGSDDELDALLDTTAGTTGTTYEDRPDDMRAAWVDRRMQRVRVAQMYYQHQGQWRLAIFTGKGDLYDEVSPYVDEDGKPTCAMILMSAYVDNENRRYGMVRDMFSAQDEINKRRSKLLHQLNTRQTMGIEGAVESVAGMKRELSNPDGHVSITREAVEDAAAVGMRPFEIIPQTDQVQGQASLLAEAKDEIDQLGPNASLQGQMPGSASGRAIMAQQQAGLAELSPIYDSLRDWTERVYRAVWNRIRQFWDGPRWIRITDENEAPQFIGINQPVMTEQGMMMQNPVAQIDVDIIVGVSPDFVTLRQEQFDRLVDLAKSGMNVPMEVIIEASDLRDKRKLLEAMRGDPQQAEQMAMLQQQVQALEMQLQEAKVAKEQAQAQKYAASAQKDMASIEKDMAGTEIDRFKALTDRAEAEADFDLGMERVETDRAKLAVEVTRNPPPFPMPFVG